MKLRVAKQFLHLLHCRLAPYFTSKVHRLKYECMSSALSPSSSKVNGYLWATVNLCLVFTYAGHQGYRRLHHHRHLRHPRGRGLLAQTRCSGTTPANRGCHHCCNHNGSKSLQRTLVVQLHVELWRGNPATHLVSGYDRTVNGRACQTPNRPGPSPVS